MVGAQAAGSRPSPLWGSACAPGEDAACPCASRGPAGVGGAEDSSGDPLP